MLEISGADSQSSTAYEDAHAAQFLEDDDRLLGSLMTVLSVSLDFEELAVPAGRPAALRDDRDDIPCLNGDRHKFHGTRIGGRP